MIRVTSRGQCCNIVELFISGTNKYIGVFSIINVWIRTDKWSEEDIHPMENPEPNIVPPMEGSPQVPPQQGAGNRRRVYIPPTYRRTPTPAYRPVSWSHTQNRYVYIVPSFTQDPPLSQQVMQKTDEFVAPVIKLPTKPRTPVVPGVPETPGLLEMSPIQELRPDILIRTSQTEIPVTPSCSMPGYPGYLGYLANEVKRQEPGVAETLLGCGLLFLAGIIVLLILYYLAT
jgi:hypothetical protein